MKKNLLSVRNCAAVLALVVSLPAISQDNNLLLWYKKPATKWTEALPIGNGRLGGMVYGGVAEEHIQLNESTLWTGRPRNYNRQHAVQYLEPIRTLLRQGKQGEAEKLAGEQFMGVKSVDDSVYAQRKRTWLKQVSSQTQWSQPGVADKLWDSIRLPMLNGWEAMGLDGLDGAVWFRTSFELPDAWQGKELVLALGKIRDMDYTYVNGKMVAAGEGINTKRVYAIPAAALKPGKNVLAIQVINFYDKGGFAGVKSDERILAVYPKGATAESGIALSNVWKYKIQNATPPEFPQYQARYQPLGDVYFRFPVTGEVEEYKRDLDLATATAHVQYKAGGVQYKRSYFVSAPHRAMVARFTADKPGALNVEALLGTSHKAWQVKQIDARTLALEIQVKDGALRGTSYMRVFAQKGSVAVKAGRLVAKGADAVTFYITAATNFKNYQDVSGNPAAICKTALQALGEKDFTSVEAAHLKDYQSLFNAFSLSFGGGNRTDLSTDERIRQYSPVADPGLLSLYTQYGRYLLISSSRPGGQAANLQGIWNELLTPPWGSKYTTNINLQMNYWLADVLNLSGCTAPLFDLIAEAGKAGEQTAKEYYGAPGWVLHHNTDIWRGTAPINASNHGIWVTGAAWLCHHIWDHYQFTQDTAFLRKYYPLMKSAASFFNSFLVKEVATGKIISTPSNSPEHGGLVAGPAMDHQIIRNLYKACIAAAAVLKVDSDSSIRWQQQYDAIAPNIIGRYGQLQEWMKDVDDTADTHRHVSHLWGVYPGTDITWQTPEQMKAARQSLLYRGDGGTGWSLAWKVNLWARFLEGDHALLILSNLLAPAEKEGKEQGGVYSNLMDAHPPFQIDGNFGGAAGLAEMLVQSQGEGIVLLPALPAALAEGQVSGIKARGGFVLQLVWQQQRLQTVVVTSLAGKTCKLIYKGKEKSFATKAGQEYVMEGW